MLSSSGSFLRLAMDFAAGAEQDAGMRPHVPRSPYDSEGGIFYFPRMLDKIRMKQRGELPEDYHANLGHGFDKCCCDFLHVDHDAVAARVGAGLGDAAVLAWCLEHGRRPEEHEIRVWNDFMRKRGWNDELSDRVRERLAGLGMSGRADVQTLFDLLEVDEGRPSRGTQ